MVESQTVEPSASLSAPVGHLMRPTLTCDSGDSIQRAVGELRRNGGGSLPIVSDGRLAGAVTERSLAAALADGVDVLQPCSDALENPTTIAPYASAAEALRLLSNIGVGTLVVVDDANRVVGLLSPSDLYPRRRQLPRPDPVGGMATPFGVYLTSGGLSGGVSLLAIVGTGALMFSMLVVSNVAAFWMLSPLDKTSLSDPIKDTAAGGLLLLLFGLMMRLAPLSGTHGAEHMVVHAMERGEELTPEVVARMPRVHPRCGTNLAVAITLFTGISQTEWIKQADVRTVVAAITTLFLWKPVGSFVQQYITTKKPNAKQLRSGIKAGNELIERYSTAHFQTVGIPRRLWNSGLLQVISGSTLAWLALSGAVWLFHIKVPGLE